MATDVAADSIGSTAVSPADRGVAVAAFVAALCFLLLFGSGITKAVDEGSLLSLTRSLVDDRSVEITPRPLGSVEGRDGSSVSKYGLGQPVLAIPFELIGRLLGLPLDDPGGVRDATTTTVGAVATAAAVAWAYLLGRRLGGRPRDALGVAALAAGASLAVVYGTEFYTGPLLALCLIVAVERMVAGRWSWGFAALAVGCVTHARLIPIAVVFALVAVVVLGLRRAVVAVWPLAVAAVITLAYAYVRFGSVTGTGYEGEEFTTSPLDGSWGLVFEHSKSVLVFLPLAVLGTAVLPRLARPHRLAAVLIAISVASVWTMTVSWYGWNGGWAWGPRFLLPVAVLGAVPLAPWLSADRSRWGAVGAAALVGVLASFPALIAADTVQKDLPGFRVGPGVVEQYGLIPDVIRSGFAGECVGRTEVLDSVPDPLRRCGPSLWQFHVGRTVGPVGDVVIVALSVALAAGAWRWGRVAWSRAGDAEDVAPDGPPGQQASSAKSNR